MNLFKLSRYAGIGVAVLLGFLGMLSFVMMFAQGKDSSFIDFGLSIAIFAVGFLIPALLLVFIIRNAVQNPKSMIKAIIGVAALAIIFIIAYSMGSDELILEGRSYETVEMLKKVPKSAVKMSDAGIIMMVIMMALSIVSIVVSSVWRLFK